jgi:hypothetical protein
MLTRQALLGNLNKRYILLCRLFLRGFIKEEKLIRVLRRFNRRINPDVSYDYLLVWERRLSRIEDKV